MDYKEFIKKAEEIGVGGECTCTIDGKKIEDAKLQFEDDDWYICQNEIDGVRCSDELGYKYSWACNKDYVFGYLQDFGAKKKGIFKGGLEVGDRLIDSENDEYMVMATLDDVVFLGVWNDGDSYIIAHNWYGYDELVKAGFELVEEKKPKMMTKEEIEKELGYKITIK